MKKNRDIKVEKEKYHGLKSKRLRKISVRDRTIRKRKTESK